MEPVTEEGVGKALEDIVGMGVSKRWASLL